jgi:hypothetical protein
MALERKSLKDLALQHNALITPASAIQKLVDGLGQFLDGGCVISNFFLA